MIDKWRFQGFLLTQNLAQEEENYKKLTHTTDIEIEQLKCDTNNIQKEIKLRTKQIQDAQDEISALESSIQMINSNCDKISQKIQNSEQEFNIAAESLKKHLQTKEIIEQYIKEKDQELVSKIPYEKLNQLTYLSGLLAKIIGLQKSRQKKQREIDERTNFYTKLEILNQTLKKQKVLKSQWEAISVEIEKSTKEREEYEKLKEQFVLLQKQGKVEHNEREEQGRSQKQALTEERDQLLAKQRELENVLSEESTKFQKARTESQDEVDKIYEHINQQEQQIADLKEKIEIAKNAIDSRKNISVMTDTIPQTTRPVTTQTAPKNQPILGIDGDAFEKPLDLNLDFGDDDKSEIFGVLNGLLERAKEITLRD